MIRLKIIAFCNQVISLVHIYIYIFARLTTRSVSSRSSSDYSKSSNLFSPPTSNRGRESGFFFVFYLFMRSFFFIPIKWYVYLDELKNIFIIISCFKYFDK